VHRTGIYSARMGPKGPALKRFPDIKNKIKKKKKKLMTLLIRVKNYNSLLSKIYMTILHHTSL
jgi:hypothetical protein